jgi:hypothetical protein
MRRGVAVALAIPLPSATVALGQTATRGIPFEAPVKVTPEFGGGYEPAAVVNSYGNVFVTAHKENWELLLSSDGQSPNYTRSMSWKWMSSDKTVKEIPGMPMNLENHQFGDEGDLVMDGANHLYFVDTAVVDNTVTRWTITGKNAVTFDFSRPIVPSGQLVDDRPRIAAHGNGKVFYTGNTGVKQATRWGTAAAAA